MVHGGQGLDRADRAGVNGEGPDDAGVAPAEGIVADPRDVVAAPPGSTAVAGAVLVAAHPLGVVGAIPLGAGRASLSVLLFDRLGRPRGRFAQPWQPEGETLGDRHFGNRRTTGSRRKLGGIQLEERTTELLA